jgi:signal transduction histidine kinase/ligand-binding sensor domain-containing protein/DNA-binding response OmpR family regulator
MKTFTILLLIISTFITSIHAAYFRNYRIEEGLSHNSVWAVMQDSEGFIWIGTRDGLNRFDGKNFKIHRHQPDDTLSIGHSFIHFIKEDSQGRMLIGTRQGLYLFNKKNEHFKKIKLTDKDNEHVVVNYILEDRYENIWLATHGSGIYKLNKDLIVEKQYRIEEWAGLLMNHIWTITSDNSGNIWLGTAGRGMVHFDPRNEIFTPIQNRESLNISQQSIYSIYYDTDNYLWIGTSNNGLFKYNYISGEAHQFLPGINNIKSITKYADKKLVMGSDKGLIVFDIATGNAKIVEEDLSAGNIADDAIFAIAVDKEGSFWIGTYFGGLSYYAPAVNELMFHSNLIEQSAPKHIVSSMVEDNNGNVLIGTHNNNLIYRFNKEKKKLEKIHAMSHQNILSLLSLQNDQLLVGVYGRGIKVISQKDYKTIKDININIIEGNSLFSTSNGQVIVALEEGGCMLIDEAGQTSRLTKLANFPIADIAEGNDGSIWFATHANGLYRMKPDQTWEIYTSGNANENSLTSNFLNSLFFDTNNRLWIGSKNHGIILFHPEEKTFSHRFNTDNGLPSNLIYTLLDDSEGSIWASTGGGIVKISKDLDQVQSLGYIGNEMQYNKTALRSSDNYLYFGGTNGYIILNPAKLSINKTKPEVFITNFRIFNSEVIPGEKGSPLVNSLKETSKITLNNNQSTFSFDFISLSFISPEHNRYAYKLEGFDKDWNYGNETRVNYMNIPRGKYTFRVKGTNNDGLWSEEAQIGIRIKPPFVLSGIMIVFYLLLSAAVSYLLIKRYNRYINKENQEKLYKYKAAKEKEIYESKINFFTNIAHEIRTPLSLISAPLEKIMLSGDGNEQTRKSLHTIERNANRLLELVNQLLDFRKIENDMFLLKLRHYNVNSVVKKVLNQYQYDANNNNIEMTLDSPEEIESIIDPEAIYKILSNLISNALKFAKNKVEIKIKREEDVLFIIVKDDGIGIEERYIKKIFKPFYQVQDLDNVMRSGSGLGLSLSRSLAKKHKGDIFVKSEFGKGSTFTLELPIVTNNDAILKEVEEPSETQESLSSPENKNMEQSLKVLIVEDNKELRTFIIESLLENYFVFQAENGIKALEIIEKENLDIVISDIMMPEMDGFELCNRIKDNPAYSHLPLILLSAKTDTLSKISGLKKGADIYMEKPFSIEQLKAQINSIIENRNNIRNRFIESPLQYFKQSSEQPESAEFIKKLNAIILENMSDENFTIDLLSDQFAISRSNFHKKIKNITGMTPNDYIKLIRLNKSVQLLSTGKYRINEVCYLVGFNTPSYFSKCFFEKFGKLPKEYILSSGEE